MPSENKEGENEMRCCVCGERWPGHQAGKHICNECLNDFRHEITSLKAENASLRAQIEDAANLLKRAIGKTEAKT